MKGLFDDQTVPIQCVKCGHKAPKSIGWLKAHSKFACPCGTIIEIEACQFREEIARSDRTFEDLKRNMKHIGES